MSRIRNKFQMTTQYAGRWRKNAGTKLYIHRSQIRRLIKVSKKRNASISKRKPPHQ